MTLRRTIAAALRKASLDLASRAFVTAQLAGPESRARVRIAGDVAGIAYLVADLLDPHDHPAAAGVESDDEQGRAAVDAGGARGVVQDAPAAAREAEHRDDGSTAAPTELRCAPWRFEMPNGDVIEQTPRTYRVVTPNASSASV